MTRRLLTIKWTFYGLWTLLFLLVQQLVLPYIRIWASYSAIRNSSIINPSAAIST